MTEPYRMLGRAVAALQSGLMPEDVRAWLLNGLQRYRAGADAFDVCMGLRPSPGKRSAPTAALLDWRDGYICAMANVMPGEPYDKAGQIADFLAGRTPHVPPGLAADLAFQLIGSGAPLPESQGQIWRIMSGNRSQV